MNVLITPNFSNAMQTLNKSAQKDVVDIFSRISAMTREELEKSSSLQAVQGLTDTASSIYVYKGSVVRVFITLDDNENVLFLELATTPLSIEVTEAVGEIEVTLYDKDGTPIAYIATDEDRTIYSFDGRPLAYLEGNSIYGFNGNHLGWFEDGVVRDKHGHPAGFVSQRLKVFARFQPHKSFKKFKPFKRFRRFAQFKPFDKSTPSSQGLKGLLESGAK